MRANHSVKRTRVLSNFPSPPPAPPASRMLLPCARRCCGAVWRAFLSFSQRPISSVPSRPSGARPRQFVWSFLGMGNVCRHTAAQRAASHRIVSPSPPALCKGGQHSSAYSPSPHITHKHTQAHSSGTSSVAHRVLVVAVVVVVWQIMISTRAAPPSNAQMCPHISFRHALGKIISTLHPFNAI